MFMFGNREKWSFLFEVGQIGCVLEYEFVEVSAEGIFQFSVLFSAV